jgi:hypothetical protein
MESIKPGYVYCDKCKFIVKEEGHEGRCQPKKDSAEVAIDKRKSWLGDARHMLDVRLVLCSLDIPDAELTTECVKYIRGEAQAGYYRSLPEFPHELKEASDKVVATAFEANYFGEFRKQYLTRTFGHLTSVKTPREFQRIYDTE